MIFDKALEFASGRLPQQNLRAYAETQSSESCQSIEQSTAESSQSQDSEIKKPMFTIGKFQIFSVLLIILGITSGSQIIYPLSFLELMPEFKCEVE